MIEYVHVPYTSGAGVGDVQGDTYNGLDYAFRYSANSCYKV